MNKSAVTRLLACHFYVATVLLLAFSTSAQSVENSLRITDRPLSLNIHFHYRNSSVYDPNWPVEREAANMTGISLNSVGPEHIKDSSAAFNLMMANGDLPDIVGGNFLQQKFNQFGPAGEFIPLDDLIEEYAPHIKEVFEKSPEIKKSIQAADGNLYFIPYLPDGKYGRAYFIRTDWLRKLELSTPETVDELYTVLTAFKHQDPNGNGLDDEIPFFARNFEEMVRLVTLWDARTTGTDTWHDFYVEDGQIQHGYNKETYRIGISNLAKWYKEGLIDPEVFRRGRKAREFILENDLGGMTHDWFASTASFNQRYKDTIEGFEFKAISPPASPSGRRLEEHRRAQVKPDGWAITRANRNPIETIRYFDFWFSPEGKRLANFGVEGEHYNLVDGKPQFTDEILNGELPVNTRMWEVGAQIPRGFPQDYGYEIQWSNEIALEGIALYDEGDYLVEPFLGVSLTTTEKDVIDQYWESVKIYMLERQEDWVLGNRDVNADWDSYLSVLDKLGMKKVLATMQTAYERQYK